MKTERGITITNKDGNNANLLLATVPDYVFRQEHDEEIEGIMSETGCTFGNGMARHSGSLQMSAGIPVWTLTSVPARGIVANGPAGWRRTGYKV